MLIDYFLIHAKNYLSTDDSYYLLSSCGKGYKTKQMQSTVRKIIKFASFLLVMPPLITLFVEKICQHYSQIRFTNIQENTSPECGIADVIATKDCLDTHEWRKKLIGLAEHNIVISGNYCGDQAFNEVLTCILARLREVKELRVVIIAHPKFLKNNNKILMKKIRTYYKKRFVLIASPNINLGFKNITNHTKCTVIDYGKYYIQGGTGIKDNFRYRGKFSKSKKTSVQPKTKDDAFCVKKEKKEKTAYDDIVISSINENVKKIDRSAVFEEKLLPNSFRDQDFVFYHKQGEEGNAVYQEALFLAYKWDRYAKDKSFPRENWDLKKLDPTDVLFKRYPTLLKNKTVKKPPEENKNPLYHLLKTGIPLVISESQSSYKNFLFQDACVDVNVRTFFTGPEDYQSDWKRNMIEKVRQAQKRIAIDHMYFQPPSDLRKAIAEAANRGVKITIVTALGSSAAPPTSEKFFAPRNLVNLFKLKQDVLTEKRDNLTFYSYAQGKNGLHKKVMIIDDYILAGSGNMGTKSLTLIGDHEMNFEAKSQELAKKTMAIIQKDILKSRKITNINPSVRQRVQSMFHYWGSNKWG